MSIAVPGCGEAPHSCSCWGRPGTSSSCGTSGGGWAWRVGRWLHSGGQRGMQAFVASVLIAMPPCISALCQSGDGQRRVGRPRALAGTDRWLMMHDAHLNCRCRCSRGPASSTRSGKVRAALRSRLCKPSAIQYNGESPRRGLKRCLVLCNRMLCTALFGQRLPPSAAACRPAGAAACSNNAQAY